MKMNEKKAAGHDGICAKELKMVADKIAWQLAILFNESLETGEIPSDFKVGNICSVYSFSRSCPKTVSRTRVVFPTGSTTLLRLQLWRTKDCAHRSRQVQFFFFLLWRDRCLPKVSWKSNPAAPCLANQVWPFKRALHVPGKTLMVGWGLLAHASRGHLRWSVEG